MGLVHYLLIAGVGGLALIALMAYGFSGPLSYLSSIGKESSAYYLTEKVATGINLLSSYSNEGILKVNMPDDMPCNVYIQRRTVKSETKIMERWVPYGMFLVDDVNSGLGTYSCPTDIEIIKDSSGVKVQ